MNLNYAKNVMHVLCSGQVKSCGRLKCAKRIMTGTDYANPVNLMAGAGIGVLHTNIGSLMIVTRLS